MVSALWSEDGVGERMNTEEVIDILQGIKDGTACLMKNMPQRGETAIDTAIDIISKHRIGKWIPSDSQCGIRCSVCGVPVDDFCHSIDYIDLDYEPNYCPNCGLKMM